MSSDYTSSEYSSSSVNNYSDDNKDNFDLQGEILNKYNIICEIGRGAFSIVWLGYNISDNKYYAIKVQNYNDYEDGMDEIEALKRIKHNTGYLNTMIEYFIEKRKVDDEYVKSICSVYELCCGNIDKIARKGKYPNGYPEEVVNVIFKQLVIAINDLHNKNKMFHGDIKPDNILLVGLNNYDKKIIEMYEQSNFIDTYTKIKQMYWVEKGRDLKNISKMKLDIKLKIRAEVHKKIVDKIFENEITENKYEFDEKYLDPNQLKIKLTDFGSYCPDGDFFEESFGTVYYQAPEIILMDRCKRPVDIWALGCTLYELLCGKVLFDPYGDDSDEEGYEHLKMIIDLCGKIKKDTFKRSEFYKKFFKNMNLSSYNRSNTNSLKENLNERLENIHNKDYYVSLLTSMLCVLPQKRVKIEQLKVKS